MASIFKPARTAQKKNTKSKTAAKNPSNKVVINGAKKPAAKKAAKKTNKSKK